MIDTLHWPSFLRELDAAERAWNSRTVRYPREDAVPWLPFPRGPFIALLADAVEAAPARMGTVYTTFGGSMVGNARGGGGSSQAAALGGTGDSYSGGSGTSSASGGSPGGGGGGGSWHAAFLPPRFLDIGAGTGTKLRLAQALFGLDCHGIEIVPELAAEAQAHGADVEVADAFAWDGYDRADIVYVNRPSTFMEQLESTVMDGMASGAVLMMVNGRCDPGRDGWTLVSREWGEPVHGCWIKP